MSINVRVSNKTKTFIKRRKKLSPALTEGEILELEIFGVLSKRK